MVWCVWIWCTEYGMVCVNMMHGIWYGVCENDARNIYKYIYIYFKYVILQRTRGAQIWSIQPVEANTVRGRRRLQWRANDRMWKEMKRTWGMSSITHGDFTLFIPCIIMKWKTHLKPTNALFYNLDEIITPKQVGAMQMIVRMHYGIVHCFVFMCFLRQCVRLSDDLACSLYEKCLSESDEFSRI